MCSLVTRVRAYTINSHLVLHPIKHVNIVDHRQATGTQASRNVGYIPSA